MELLKLYSTDMSEKELKELKKVLGDYFSKKAIHEADKIWDSKGLVNEDMEKWLNE